MCVRVGGFPLLWGKNLLVCKERSCPFESNGLSQMLMIILSRGTLSVDTL